MSELPEVRRADCGHGFLPVDTPPAARHQNGMHEQPVYLCDDCRSRLLAAAVPQVEFKDASAEPATRVVPDPYAEGRRDFHTGVPEDECPYTDKRTKEAKAWLAGWREAQAEES